MPAANPSTVQLRFAPIVLPITGVVQLPVVTLAALPQDIAPGPERMSYLAGCPVPASTSVKDSVTEELVVAATARSLTVPGGVAAAITVTSAVPLLPSLVAVIVAVPAATPVTNPLPLTVATETLLVAHVTTRPLKGLPLASLGVAVNCTVAPTVTLAVAGLTVTDATGTVVTVTAAVPLLPSLVAVMVAEPAATPVTRPLPVTAATTVLLLAQVTDRPLNGAPVESSGVAVNCTVCATATLAAVGVTATVATGTCVSVTTPESVAARL